VIKVGEDGQGLPRAFTGGFGIAGRVMNVTEAGEGPSSRLTRACARRSP
jgi:hypothetical protein